MGLIYDRLKQQSIIFFGNIECIGVPIYLKAYP